MNRSELGLVLEKLEVLEGRTFTAAQADAWFEIMGEHSQVDALAAVVAFHSKPFKRPAYSSISGRSWQPAHSMISKPSGSIKRCQAGGKGELRGGRSVLPKALPNGACPELLIGRRPFLCIDELGYMELDRRGAELLFQVLTEREEKNSIAIASN